MYVNVLDLDKQYRPALRSWRSAISMQSQECPVLHRQPEHKLSGFRAEGMGALELPEVSAH